MQPNPRHGTEAKSGPEMSPSRTRKRARQPTALPAVAAPSRLPARLVADLGQAGEYARAEKSAATRRAYRTDFAIFRARCAEHQTQGLPSSPAAVAAFLAWEADRPNTPPPSTV